MAIAATTVAIGSVVLRHMREQLAELEGHDGGAVEALRDIIEDEQDHHDRSCLRLSPPGIWSRIIEPVVKVSTETVIWLGMKL